MAKKERESKRRTEMENCWCCPGQLRASRRVQASAKNLSILGQKKTLPRCHNIRSWQGRQKHLYQIEKEQNHQSRSPDRGMRKSQGEREQHLGEKEANQSGNMGRKMWTQQ